MTTDPSDGVATPAVRALPTAVDPGLLTRKHHLPHWQAGGSWYFVTFRSTIGELPTEARRTAMTCLRHGDGLKYDLYCAVVMPDHIHCILKPLRVRDGEGTANGEPDRIVGPPTTAARPVADPDARRWHDLATIMKGLKGTSARLINQALGRRGSVWQSESWDRLIRNDEEFEAWVWYMRENAVKAGIVEDERDYEFWLLQR